MRVLEAGYVSRNDRKRGNYAEVENERSDQKLGFDGCPQSGDRIQKTGDRIQKAELSLSPVFGLLFSALPQAHGRVAQEDPGAAHVRIGDSGFGVPGCLAQTQRLATKQLPVELQVHRKLRLRVGES